MSTRAAGTARPCSSSLHLAFGLCELLLYGLTDQGEDGSGAILRAVRDELRALASLALCSNDNAADLLSHAELGAALDGVVRRLDVVIELNERARKADAEGAKGAEAAAP